MYVEMTKNNGTDYLRLVRNDRILNSKGIKTSTKKVVYNIGPLSRFDDGQPDYVERLKKSFKAGCPLIPALLPFCEKETPAETYLFSIKEGSTDCFGHPRLFSPLLFRENFRRTGAEYVLFFL